ncbi:DNA-dependent RNA polymerase [Heterostelium album PN500]|uniref:DNA-directed RNA polymerase n=1 Tax=Heterostelium pallidum (strain ATCC 26659 / Pp 5 / PN500) TaxID=670386 RepID=D3B0H1_HETP5|nr:DNA-dependent RNA polymerase [Heterostelium album PN500]EFA84795.1 DNA-dependent RNA polymerase [Heterostelium album PN500]|eukprot:XP_020436906.1 DNA-dependent RNA polymerase [Heterostelium album PN500]
MLVEQVVIMFYIVCLMLRISNSKYISKVISSTRSTFSFTKSISLHSIYNNNNNNNSNKLNNHSNSSNNINNLKRYCSSSTLNNNNNNNINRNENFEYEIDESQIDQESLEQLRKLIKKNSNKNKDGKSLSSLNDAKFDNIQSLEDLESVEPEFDISSELARIESLLTSEMQLEALEEMERNELDAKTIAELQKQKEEESAKYKELYEKIKLETDFEISVTDTARKAYRQLLNDTSMIQRSTGLKSIKNVMFQCCMINKYIDGEDIDEKVPAFYYKYRYNNNKKYGVISCHDNVYSLMDEGHFLVEAMNARLLPMVVPPQPWTHPNKGCYLQYPCFIMRTNGSKLQKTSLYQSDLTNIYEGLNVLGEVPWKTNEKMMSILLEAWEKGGGIADLPSRYDFELPESPSQEDLQDEKVKRDFNKKLRKVKGANNDLHSLRCDTLYKLNVAKQLQEYTFYFPHNVDFRGRSYPIPPHLNHMGSDFCRSMLKFAEEKELGERGFEWLKVQVANLFGVDKVSFEDRVAFTMENIENIYDSADRPLDGKRWWLKADSPWQTLAACIELTDAIRSGNPTTFKSSLPIHQDGTCNGLQHYAALGGDELGALKVNLLPSPKPQDVYTGVAQMVAQIVHEDALAGDELAKLLDGKIERKIIKQTVMTSVYGVTFVGARMQIENALSDKYQIDEATLFKATTYLSKTTFASLDKMFIGARSIMAWLAQCAGLISKQTGECVAWYTPLGLPVVQPYRKGGKVSVKTIMNDYLMVEDNDHLPVDSRKQRSAFPPNFIHSLDSTHMFLTAIQCKKKGITFASVHDSFWTHASTIDTMNTMLRHQFVELHSQPILERLREWFNHRYPTVNIPPVPNRGSLDLKKVRDNQQLIYFTTEFDLGNVSNTTPIISTLNMGGASGGATANSTSSTSTTTTTTTITTTSSPQQPIALRLTIKSKKKKRVQWSEETVDNENMLKKKSKSKKPYDESSDESGSEDDHDHNDSNDCNHHECGHDDNNNSSNEPAAS